MPARLLHLSDLHMGRSAPWEPLPAIQALIADLEPELIVVTGDLAHRGRRAELETASGFLRGLGLPLLVVPGNHDIPYTVPARFTRTYAAWHDVFGPTEPTYTSESFVVAGVSSVRAWRQQGGAVDRARLAAAVERAQQGAPDALRVVALHHHLAAPPWRVARKRPLSDRDDVLRALLAGGIELVIGGHVHQASVTERREFKVLEDGPRVSLVLATAAAIGRPRPQRKEEARGLNVYEADASTIRIRTFSWDGAGLLQVGERLFARR